MPSDHRDDPFDPFDPDPSGALPPRGLPSGGEWARRARETSARLRVLLPGLVERRVPVRLVEHGPVAGVGRLRMADGTAFLVASVDPLALGRVVRALSEGRAVVVTGWRETDQGLVLDLAVVGGRGPLRGRASARRGGAVRVRLVGPDQPD